MHQQLKPEAIFQFLSAGLVCGASFLAYLIRFQSVELPSKYLAIALALTLLSMCALSINSYYEKTRSRSWSIALLESLKVMIFAGTLVALLLFLTKSGADFSRIWMTYTVLFASMFIALARSLLNKLSSNAYKTKNVLLLGERSKIRQIKSPLIGRGNRQVNIVKQFNLLDVTAEQQLSLVTEYIESVRNTDNSIAEIWVTADIYRDISHVDLQVALSDASARLVYIPLLPDLGFDYEIENIDGILTINSGLTGANRLRSLVKTFEDLALSCVALALLLPIFLIIAVAIKLDSKGPVFYKQKRYGINGREIMVWKFRSMTVTENSGEFVQATEQDPRVTRVGRFLRKSSLDELPQLFNVLGGSMSLVGPRPHPNLLNEQYRNKIDFYMQRHSVKPGITGLAQANGARGETDTIEKMERRIMYDLEYIKSWSTLLDLQIIIKTVAQVIKQAVN